MYIQLCFYFRRLKVNLSDIAISSNNFRKDIRKSVLDCQSILRNNLILHFGSRVFKERASVDTRKENDL